jgi:hypothetical protein
MMFLQTSELVKSWQEVVVENRAIREATIDSHCQSNQAESGEKV